MHACMHTYIYFLFKFWKCYFLHFGVISHSERILLSSILYRCSRAKRVSGCTVWCASLFAKFIEKVRLKVNSKIFLHLYQKLAVTKLSVTVALFREPGNLPKKSFLKSDEFS